MKKIIRLKNLIEEALATHTGFEPYFLPSSNAWSDMPKILKPSEELKTAAAEYLIDFQREFIEARNKAENSTAFLKKELERIEGLFSLPTYSVEFSVRVRDGKTQKEIRTEIETFYYDFAAIEADLPQGRIKGESQHGVICYLLATANYYLWLKELAAQPSNGEPEEFRQIWLNPAEDIPFVLEALKDLEFIDENEVWRWNKIADYPGGVIDAISRQKKTRLISKNYLELNKVFGRRFKFPDPEKRFERHKGTYKKSLERMDNYLKNKK